MKPPEPVENKIRNDEDPGLPGLHSWPAVYLLVLGSFALWIVLLVALTRMYP
jgi:hypothetical protein